MKFGTHIFPFILSFVGAIAIACFIVKNRQQYHEEVEEAREKYNIDND